MKKIISAVKTDPEKIHESLKTGFGLEHPEKINGYVGFFVNYGDVYVSDDIAQRMECNKDFSDFIYRSIHDFQNDSYGVISSGDDYLNVENKWIAGGGPLFGRYPYGAVREVNGYQIPADFIKIRYVDRNTYVSYDSDWDEKK